MTCHRMTCHPDTREEINNLIKNVGITEIDSNFVLPKSIEDQKIDIAG